MDRDWSGIVTYIVSSSDIVLVSFRLKFFVPLIPLSWRTASLGSTWATRMGRETLSWVTLTTRPFLRDQSRPPTPWPCSASRMSDGTEYPSF